MDCLINVEVALGDGRWFVCEVQLVHSQLLTVRAELGFQPPHQYQRLREQAPQLLFAA